MPRHTRYIALSALDLFLPVTWGLRPRLGYTAPLGLVSCGSAGFAYVLKVWGIRFIPAYDVGHGLYLRLRAKGLGLKPDSCVGLFRILKAIATPGRDTEASRLALCAVCGDTRLLLHASFWGCERRTGGSRFARVARNDKPEKQKQKQIPCGNDKKKSKSNDNVVGGRVGHPPPSSYNSHLKCEMWGTRFGFNFDHGHPLQRLLSR